MLPIIVALEDVLKIYSALREDCQRYSRSMSTALRLDPMVPPVNVFGMCHNTATMIDEALWLYHEKWQTYRYEKITDQMTIDHIQKELCERIILASKMLFVWILSHIENGMKTTIDERRGIVAADKSSPLRIIINNSAKSGLINEDDRQYWRMLIELRNRLVHYNGNSNIDLSMTFPNGAIVSMQRGRMVVLDIKAFPHISRWAVGSYASWSAAMVERARQRSTTSP